MFPSNTTIPIVKYAQKPSEVMPLGIDPIKSQTLLGGLSDEEEEDEHEVYIKEHEVYVDEKIPKYVLEVPKDDTASISDEVLPSEENKSLSAEVAKERLGACVSIQEPVFITKAI